MNNKIVRVSGRVIRELKTQNETIKAENDAIMETLKHVENIAVCFANDETLNYDDMVCAMVAIANEISKTRVIVWTRDKKLY